MQVESFESQRRVILAFATSAGYEIVKWYREAYTGADTERRKVFLRMIDDVCSGRHAFEHIVCYDVSRFGRMDNDEAGYYRHVLRKHGVEVLYAAEGLAGNPTDDLVVSIRQWLAREFARKHGQYVLRSLLTRTALAASDPRILRVSAPPYGYDVAYVDENGNPYAVVRRLPGGPKEVYSPDGDLQRVIPSDGSLPGTDKDGKILVPSSRERVDTVRNVFEWLVEDDLGQNAIAARLNDAMQCGNGPSSPTGGTWSRATIQGIVTNQAYIGNTVLNRRRSGRFFRIRCGAVICNSKGSASGYVSNPPEDWIVVENTHEPIVEPDVFWRAQKMRAKRRTDPYPVGTIARSGYVFAGRLRCGECGLRYHRLRHRKTGERGYVCSAVKSRGGSFCSARLFVPERLVEEIFLGGLAAELRTIGKGDVVARAGEILMAQVARDIKVVDTDLRRLDRCVDERTGGPIREKMAAIRARRRKLLSQLKALEDTPENTWLLRRVKRLLDLAHDFSGSRWPTNTEEKQRVVSLTLDHITIQESCRKTQLWWSEAMLLARKAVGACARFPEADDGARRLEASLPLLDGYTAKTHPRKRRAR